MDKLMTKMMMILRSKLKWKWPAANKIRKSLLYKVILVVVAIGSLIYLIDFTQLPIHISQYSKKILRPGLLLSKDEENYLFEEEIDENYFVKTQGCRIIKMPVMSPQISSFFSMDKPKAIECGAKALTDSDENFLWISLNENELKMYYNVAYPNRLRCYYTPFSRLTDYTVRNESKSELFYGKRVKIDAEFIHVYCDYENRSQIYIDYHSFFPIKKEVEEQRKKAQEHEQYNVMVLGIDSVSKLNFHRMFNQTKATVIETLKGIEMKGYNKVADNTYPNLIPLLSGLNTDEINSACLTGNVSMYFDNCEFVWNNFKRNGFGTVFSEDSAILSLFNYFQNGFEKQPVDYYFRTVLQQMEKEIAFNKLGNYKLCLGNQRPIDAIFKYIRKFIRSFHSPFFSFFWTSSLTHDFINYPLLIDEDLNNLLLTMKKEKYLEKTVLLLLSDHGMRFGSYRQTTFQGMVEERQPFMFAVIPPSFKSKYPLAVRNLMVNSRRLTTHFDIFETLKDLSNLSKSPLTVENIRRRSKDLPEGARGISLFLEVSTSRTCDNAGIESHWCTCYEKLELSTSDRRVQRAARFVVKTINDLIKNNKCHFLFLNSILSAHMHVLNDRAFGVLPVRLTSKVLRPPKGRKKIYDITLKISTKPGPRPEFEATVRLDEINDEVKLTGTISRISQYGKACIDDSFLEKYCFCDPI